MSTTKIDQGAVIASAAGIARSSHWPTVEKHFLKVAPNCAVCDPVNYGKVGVQVHHAVVPFHLAIMCGRPDLELDLRNLIGLCESEKDRPAEDHHLKVGHLLDFKSWNPNVFQDAKDLKGRTGQFLTSSQAFQAKVKARPDPVKAEKHDALVTLRAYLDKTLPPDPVLCKLYGFVIKPFV